MLRTRLRRLGCFIRRRHRWKLHDIVVDGVLTVIPRCSSCGHVDIDRIREATWNRKARRRFAKRVGLR